MTDRNSVLAPCPMCDAVMVKLPHHDIYFQHPTPSECFLVYAEVFGEKAATAWNRRRALKQEGVERTPNSKGHPMTDKMEALENIRLRNALEKLLAIFDIYPVVLDDEQYDAFEEARGALATKQEGVDAGHPEPSSASTPSDSRTNEPAGMREALERAAAAFERYANGHRQKGTVEGEQKAAANDHMAYVCRTALSSFTEGK